MPNPIKLTELLINIPSPTYHEAKICAWIANWLTTHLPQIRIRTESDSLIAELPGDPNLPHLALIGHSDVVPAFKEADRDGDRLVGPGASDMKSGLGAFMAWLAEYHTAICRHYRVSLVVYSREEMTPLKENGLYHLIHAFPDYFKSLDLAIIGEPTDNTVQIGCMGSLHAKVTVRGIACHSARPWTGQNALYKAAPLILTFANMEPVKHTLFGVDFFDIMSITELETSKGRTTIPDTCTMNINYRYAPTYSPEQADARFRDVLGRTSVPDLEIAVFDNVPAGSVIASPLFDQVIKTLGRPLQAKQAWTDVAQITALGIPAFNFGPGRADQCHKPDEYVVMPDITAYMGYLNQLIGEPQQ